MKFIDYVWAWKDRHLVGTVNVNLDISSSKMKFPKYFWCFVSKLICFANIKVVTWLSCFQVYLVSRSCFWHDFYHLVRVVQLFQNPIKNQMLARLHCATKCWKLKCLISQKSRNQLFLVWAVFGELNGSSGNLMAFIALMSVILVAINQILHMNTFVSHRRILNHITVK